MWTMSRETLAVLLSIVAIVVSAATLYFSDVRPISVELAVSKHAYISNTHAGLPDVSVRFAIYANGAATKSVPVQSAEIIITNVGSEEEFTLSIPGNNVDEGGFPIILQGDEGGFPIILQGGEGYLGDDLFVYVESLKDRVNRHVSWFAELSRIRPEEAGFIGELERAMRNSIIPILGYDGPEDLDVGSGIRELLGKISGDPRVEMRSKGLRGLLYFRAGDYTMEFIVRDSKGNALATHKAEFSISDVLEETLVRRFNENTLVITSNPL